MTRLRDEIASSRAYLWMALTLAVLVWLVYFVIEATRLLNIWPA